MKKTLSLLLFVVLAWPLSVFGQLSNDVRSLKGIEGLDVVVENIGEEYERVGFSRKGYENAIELRLRSLGIQIDEEARPYLYLNVAPIRVNDRIFAVSIDLFVKQRVLPVDDNLNPRYTIPVSASTWSVGSMAIIGKNRIGEGIMKDWVVEQVDMFANDYLKANPPEPRSGQEGD